MPEIPEDVHEDAEGFMVCETHRQRRYGWRSREKRHMHRCDWMTDLEYERFVIYGKQPEMAVTPIQQRVEDIRDNRDPATVVAER